MRHLLLTALLLGVYLDGWAQPASLVPSSKPLLAGKPPMPLAKGQPGPDFRLMDTSGKAVALRDLRGKVVYLDFWYSGCRPCLAEAPAAAKLKQQFAGQDVELVYISIETNVDNWRQAVEKKLLGRPHQYSPARPRRQVCYPRLPRIRLSHLPAARPAGVRVGRQRAAPFRWYPNSSGHPASIGGQVTGQLRAYRRIRAALAEVMLASRTGGAGP